MTDFRDAAGAGAGPGAPPVPGSPPVLPVSLLVSSARLLLERHLGLAWIAGEISGYTRAASGHHYFTLKDASAQVRCVFFRQKAQALSFALRDGLAVEVRATPTIYEARGDFQLNVDTARLAGVGALYEQFLRLKARLETAGWFDPARKRALPAFPRRVGIVTSTRAAALRDVLTTLARRYPAAPVILYPAAVQGAGAAAEIAAAIAAANARAEVDVLIVCRGGGALEDLWAFNEEPVARAIFDSRIPIVSGVGHETDFTIADFVADVRAPTPTAAAALAVPDRAALAQDLAQTARRLARAGNHALAVRVQAVDQASRRLVHPATRLAQQGERVAQAARGLARAWAYRTTLLESRLATLRGRLEREGRAPPPQRVVLERLAERFRHAGNVALERAAQRVDRAGGALAHLNPQAVLDRGYAIVTRADGAIVQAAAQVAPGDAVHLAFAQGGADAAITRRDD